MGPRFAKGSVLTLALSAREGARRRRFGLALFWRAAQAVSAMEATPETPGKAFGSAVVRITVDDREAGSPVVVALGELPNISLGVERLRTGDCVVEGDCVFERKTIRDFARSLVDGRLFAQAHRLAF